MVRRLISAQEIAGSIPASLNILLHLKDSSPSALFFPLCLLLLFVYYYLGGVWGSGAGTPTMESSAFDFMSGTCISQVAAMVKLIFLFLFNLKCLTVVNQSYYIELVTLSIIVCI